MSAHVETLVSALRLLVEGDEELRSTLIAALVHGEEPPEVVRETNEWHPPAGATGMERIIEDFVDEFPPHRMPEPVDEFPPHKRDIDNGGAGAV